MRKLDSRTYRTMPWKNGGGTTTEIARSSPSGNASALDDLDWRLSMARVEQAGPFSSFPSVDRTIAILDGDGLTLAVGEAGSRGSVTLDQGSAPFAFPADLEVMATLVGGPVEDFNVMTRRGRYRHLLSRVSLRAPTTLPLAGDLAVVVVVAGEVSALHSESSDVAAAETLRRRDALVLEGGEAVRLSPAASAELLIVDLWRGGEEAR